MLENIRDVVCKPGVRRFLITTSITVIGLLLFIVAVKQWPAPRPSSLRFGFYDNVCPEAETIVAGVMAANFKLSSATVPGAVRLILHDCFVEGCDASILIESTDPNDASEKEHPDNLSIVDAAFDNIVKAKAAIDAVPRCRGKVSCADIIVMAARDAIGLAGGPAYPVELGRLDGRSSRADSVEGKLPHATFNLDQLIQMFAAFNLSQTDMIALSGAHTVGFSHCNQFAMRISNFSGEAEVDPTLNTTYAAELRGICPVGFIPGPFVNLDDTPLAFDTAYFRDLQQSRGLLSSDQVLHTDPRSRPTVDRWADDGPAFNAAFVDAITRMARIGVKTEAGQGEVRRDCRRFN